MNYGFFSQLASDVRQFRKVQRLLQVLGHSLSIQSVGLPTLDDMQLLLSSIYPLNMYPKHWPKWKVLEQFAITHCGLSKKKANQILADVYQGANETLPILQKLKNQHKGFSELAEELENLLKRVLS